MKIGDSVRLDEHNRVVPCDPDDPRKYGEVYATGGEPIMLPAGAYVANMQFQCFLAVDDDKVTVGSPFRPVWRTHEPSRD